jgi:hypothetical protein
LPSTLLLETQGLAILVNRAKASESLSVTARCVLEHAGEHSRSASDRDLAYALWQKRRLAVLVVLGLFWAGAEAMMKFLL